MFFIDAARISDRPIYAFRRLHYWPGDHRRRNRTGLHATQAQVRTARALSRTSPAPDNPLPDAHTTLPPDASEPGNIRPADAPSPQPACHTPVAEPLAATAQPCGRQSPPVASDARTAPCSPRSPDGDPR